MYIRWTLYYSEAKEKCEFWESNKHMNVLRLDFIYTILIDTI